MSSFNKAILIGRLTRDPEMRTTSTGKKLATFSIAVDRRFKSEDGNNTDFFNVKAWGNSAEFVEKYLSKGRLVCVEGRIEIRKYTTQEGVNREAIDVVADDVRGLDRPRDDGDSAAPARAAVSATAVAEDEFDPFAED